MIVIRPAVRPCLAALRLMRAAPVAGQAQVTFVSNGQALTDAGHLVNYTEVPEGHSASTWRDHLRGVLVGLFGGQSAASSTER